MPERKPIISLDYIRYCEECNKQFLLNPRWGINWCKKTGRGRFCSDSCSRKNRRGKRFAMATEFKPTLTYEDMLEHPRYKYGVWSYRKFKKNACEDCRETKFLHIHHLDHNRANNHPNNLKTVCPDCHIKNYHRGNRKAWNKGLKMKGREYVRA